jgi:hypothetical protein
MWGNSQNDIRHAKLCVKLQPAFAVLLDAVEYAEDSESDRWEFAVAMTTLHELGLTENDLRWLVRKGYVEHAREATVSNSQGRKFRPTGDKTFCKQTCFVLTSTGITTARTIQSCQVLASDEKNHSFGSEDSLRPVTPHWDPEVRELHLGGKLVKRFRWHAMNQELVLAALQEEGWPSRIDDPLPPHAEQDPKRRLSDTIKCLNRKQVNELIHFRSDGSGEGVIWEIVTHAETLSSQDYLVKTMLHAD